MDFLIPAICIAVIGGGISALLRYQDDRIIPELDLVVGQSKQRETV